MRLAQWYETEGRHGHPWRATRDRWSVLVSEVMLHQTQVARVVEAWPPFMARFPAPASMADAAPAAVIEAWGRLGYPRRARRLWEAARLIHEHGWPDDLESLPGVGRYTARAIAAQVDDADVGAVEVNVRRVVERVLGEPCNDRAIEVAMVEIGRPLHGRDRLLAFMDLGAMVCRARDPGCFECPLHDRCTSRGPLPHERERRRQPRYEGSLRQRRGGVLAVLRAGPTGTRSLDREALDTLIDDGLAEIDGPNARLATR
ncbi:MAG TPA: A/G-specific adenine glycosylase [Acidimicrobiia bacterium]|nr:A/G-specific adenine glycosylase [Acidimicrobiia bacterium]